jgi:hypothetical protein
MLVLLTDLVGLTGTPRRAWCRSGLSLLLDVELEVAVVAVLVLQTVDFEETLLDDDLVLLIIILSNYSLAKLVVVCRRKSGRTKILWLPDELNLTPRREGFEGKRSLHS